MNDILSSSTGQVLFTSIMGSGGPPFRFWSEQTEVWTTRMRYNERSRNPEVVWAHLLNQSLWLRFLGCTCSMTAINPEAPSEVTVAGGFGPGLKISRSRFFSSLGWEGTSFLCPIFWALHRVCNAWIQCPLWHKCLQLSKQELPDNCPGVSSFLPEQSFFVIGPPPCRVLRTTLWTVGPFLKEEPLTVLLSLLLLLPLWRSGQVARYHPGFELQESHNGVIHRDHVILC